MKGQSAMNGTLLLINLAGAVGMLLWGTHMISTGILRGFGTPLRGWIGRNLNGRLRALLARVAAPHPDRPPRAGPGGVRGARIAPKQHGGRPHGDVVHGERAVGARAS